jgi:hypothetical protein
MTKTVNLKEVPGNEFQERTTFTLMKQHSVYPVAAMLAAITVMLAVVAFAMPANAVVAPQQLKYEMLNYELHSSLSKETYWKCDYPVFSGTDSAAAINRSLLDAVAGNDAEKPSKEPPSVKKAAASFIAEFDSFWKDTPNAIPWQSETSGSVLFDRSGLLTVGMTFSSFTGGAHGISNTVYFVFDSKTGKRLSVNDIFVRGYEKRLDDLIDRRFRKIKGLSMTDRLDDEKGTLFENVIRHNRNFAVTRQGITFLYNPYEIAAYVYGPTEIDLTWAELKRLVKRPLP